MPKPTFCITTSQVEQMLTERGAVVDIGQISGGDRKRLNKAAKEGRLVRYRGYWDTLLPMAGIGPLKDIWATPAFADRVPGLAR
jgi:hypothetical protein